MGGSGDRSRDGWCTPKWLAKIINVWRPQLDPCSNERSHIAAVIRLILARGDNGLVSNEPGVYERQYHSLVGVCQAGSRSRVFINPPYSRNQVARWVGHYGHTDFIFLLRWDTSTRWFAELWPKCWGAWFPSQRVNFEPPPDVEASSNPYPHALFLRSEPNGEFLTKLLDNGYLLRNLGGDGQVNIRQSSGSHTANRQGSGGVGGEGERAGIPHGEPEVGPRWEVPRTCQDGCGEICYCGIGR